jgi:hypothetical protein
LSACNAHFITSLHALQSCLYGLVIPILFANCKIQYFWNQMMELCLSFRFLKLNHSTLTLIHYFGEICRSHKCIYTFTNIYINKFKKCFTCTWILFTCDF